MYKEETVSVENNKIVLEEIYRFENTQLHKNGHDCWNLDALEKGIKEGDTVDVDGYEFEYLP